VDNYFDSPAPSPLQGGETLTPQFLWWRRHAPYSLSPISRFPSNFVVKLTELKILSEKCVIRACAVLSHTLLSHHRRQTTTTVNVLWNNSRTLQWNWNIRTFGWKLKGYKSTCNMVLHGILYSEFKPEGMWCFYCFDFFYRWRRLAKMNETFYFRYSL